MNDLFYAGCSVRSITVHVIL